jgi:hypothetical protein
MENWEIDEDLLREEKRLEELERIENFFKFYYLVSNGFKSKTNYKTGDKYVIELSFFDNSCDLKLTIDRKLYNLVDSYVRTHDKDEENYADIVNIIINDYKGDEE